MWPLIKLQYLHKPPVQQIVHALEPEAPSICLSFLRSWQISAPENLGLRAAHCNLHPRILLLTSTCFPGSSAPPQLVYSFQDADLRMLALCEQLPDARCRSGSKPSEEGTSSRTRTQDRAAWWLRGHVITTALSGTGECGIAGLQDCGKRSLTQLGPRAQGRRVLQIDKDSSVRGAPVR